MGCTNITPTQSWCILKQRFDICQCLLQVTRPLKPVQTNAWDRTLADWIKRGNEATKDYQAVRMNEIDMENGLYRYRVNSVFGSKYALTDDEVVSPQDDLGAQVSPFYCPGKSGSPLMTSSSSSTTSPDWPMDIKRHAPQPASLIGFVWPE